MSKLHLCPPIFHAYFWRSRWCEWACVILTFIRSSSLNQWDLYTESLFSLVFISYMIFSSLVKSLAWYYLLEFSQFICNLHLFAFGFNCQVVRLKPRDTIKNATLLAAKCGQNYLLIFYVFKICALCNRCLRTPNFWLEIMVIIEFESHPCNSKISDWF